MDKTITVCFGKCAGTCDAPPCPYLVGSQCIYNLPAKTLENCFVRIGKRYGSGVGSILYTADCPMEERKGADGARRVSIETVIDSMIVLTKEEELYLELSF